MKRDEKRRRKKKTKEKRVCKIVHFKEREFR